MASAGIRQLTSRRWQVYWRLDDGCQGGETFATEREAVAYRHRLLVGWEEGNWINPQRSRISFSDWANQWWEAWSSQPDRSPHSLDNTKRRLRLHLRPTFGAMPLRTISPLHVQRWQNELLGRVSHGTVMACRSILYRVLQAAEDDARIPSNPIRKVKAPKRPVNVEARFGRAKRRTFTPEEFGYLLAAVRPFYREHLVTQVGTGLRPSELLGLRVARVDLARGHLEVLDVRYDAGEYGSGYKSTPKSQASIRPVPLSRIVAKAVTRRVEAAGGHPGALVFPGPGGSRHVPRDAGVGMSVRNYRRVFKQALADLDHASDPTARLEDLNPRGPHALRATFATWLEDAAIPSRVIDELMGHEGGRGRDVSPMGALYRETTAEMLERVRVALDQRLTRALEAADGLLMEMHNLRKARMPRGRPRRRESRG